MKTTDITPDLRYSRHLALPDFGPAEQRQLTAARVMIIGVGGLGSPAALYLAAAGVGELVLADFDRVDLSNLQRQIAHSTDDLYELKVDSAADKMLAINPEATVYVIDERLQGDDLLEEINGADVVIDASDNFGTRFAVNEACFRNTTPLVSAAAIRYEGHITVFDPRDSASPCYACLYDEYAEGNEDCHSNGILSPVVGVLGSMQAVETIKLLTGIGESLVGKLLIYDALDSSWRTSVISREPACPVCSHSVIPA